MYVKASRSPKRGTRQESQTGNSLVHRAEARKSQKPQGRKRIRRAGVTRDIKVPVTHKCYRTYGQDSNNASNAETGNAQAWPGSESRKRLGPKPGIRLIDLPCGEN